MEKPIVIKGELDDYRNIMAMALRYALGRRTYATSEVPEFIMKNEEYINERICDVMLCDLHHYFEDRINFGAKDDDCDYRSWHKFKQYLLDLADKKQYKHPNFDYWDNQDKIRGIYNGEEE